MVGRAAELESLNASSMAAERGQAGLVLLSGAAGTGKTSLLTAFLTGEAGRRMTRLSGACGKSPDTTAYAGVRALLRPLALPCSGGSEHPLLRGNARAALPALRPGSVTERPFTAAAAYPVFHGLYRLMADLLAQRPVALVLDDAERCDEYSLRWLDFLLRRAGELPLLVVLAHRPGATPAEFAPRAADAWADLAARRLATTLPLPPLTPAAVEELARQSFTGPVCPSFAERLTAVSGGNPRTLTRLLRELRRDGVSPDSGGRPRATELGGQLLARSVRALLDRHPAWVREVALAIAVLGEGGTAHPGQGGPILSAVTPPGRGRRLGVQGPARATVQALGALAGVSPAQVEQALTVLRHAEALEGALEGVLEGAPEEVLEGAREPERVALANDAVRCAVLGSVDARRLAELRTRAALLLSDEGRPAEEVAELLVLLPGPPAPWMVALLRDAAEAAASRGAPAAVARYLRRVLTAQPQDVRARLQLAAALAESDPQGAAALLGAALEGAVDARSRARFALQYALTCPTVRHSGAAVRELDRAMEALRADLVPGAPAADRQLYERLRAARLVVGAAERGRPPVAVGLIRLPAAGADTPGQLRASALAAQLTALEGRSLRRTVERARGVLAEPPEASDGWSLTASAFALGLADQSEEALAGLDRVLGHLQVGEAGWTRPVALAHRALVLHRNGAVPEALADARAALAGCPEDASRARPALPRIVLAGVLIERGEPKRAEELLDGLAPPGPDCDALEQPLYLLTRARARWAARDRETALRLLLDCGRAQREAGVGNPVLAPWWVDACRLLAVLDRVGEARELAAQGSELALHWGSPRALGLAALARGAIASGPAGVQLLGEAVERLSHSPARIEQAKAELALGRALLAMGELRGAREHLRVAADLARSRGALALAGAARRLLLEAGGRMAEITASRADMLTEMERRVARLAVGGASNRQIAASLFVTVRTVETHLTSVYRKLGVTRRTGLAAALPGSTATGVRALASLP
ncbi:helix-turn-helix transcriptional regulator [Kitasatospora kifunensis]|nr:LuxR family transcriptional regulator [Kitasatospora kifunensis]